MQWNETITTIHKFHFSVLCPDLHALPIPLRLHKLMDMQPPAWYQSSSFLPFCNFSQAKPTTMESPIFHARERSVKRVTSTLFYSAPTLFPPTHKLVTFLARWQRWRGERDWTIRSWIKPRTYFGEERSQRTSWRETKVRHIAHIGTTLSLIGVAIVEPRHWPSPFQSLWLIRSGWITIRSMKRGFARKQEIMEDIFIEYDSVPNPKRRSLRNWGLDGTLAHRRSRGPFCPILGRLIEITHTQLSCLW